jgi:hypothetical protein
VLLPELPVQGHSRLTVEKRVVLVDVSPLDPQTVNPRSFFYVDLPAVWRGKNPSSQSAGSWRQGKVL